ncbi:hypothetical protein L6452_40746 [Arctium lappa]|uniref:Uncharacterized protein n=1 Tax=Arctium lappa TaxID=4217 RepID=A0ACB8XN12_ARCLA|nr:hypothetical protein L6452_40746 [Arctium lappa]
MKKSVKDDKKDELNGKTSCVHVHKAKKNKEHKVMLSIIKKGGNFTKINFKVELSKVKSLVKKFKCFRYCKVKKLFMRSLFSEDSPEIKEMKIQDQSCFKVQSQCFKDVSKRFKNSVSHSRHVDFKSFKVQKTFQDSSKAERVKTVKALKFKVKETKAEESRAEDQYQIFIKS